MKVQPATLSEINVAFEPSPQQAKSISKRHLQTRAKEQLKKGIKLVKKSMFVVEVVLLFA